MLNLMVNKIEWISMAEASQKRAVQTFFDENPNIEIINAGDVGSDFYVVYKIKAVKEKKPKKEKEKEPKTKPTKEKEKEKKKKSGRR
jgi:hypothetical protein